MTLAEAQAWAVHCFGERGCADRSFFRGGARYTVGVFTSRRGILIHGDSRHSYELAFQHAGKPADMNHPAMLRVSLREAVEKETGTQATQQRELFV